ncbi:hypothetical protein [Massilia timonae]|uniref:hypothetical protein n=1 Tax=Massilia timonae TaxID=47229 RepID=UPI00289B72E4|nr:hypothetical protein [Massilia timonae]
MDTGSYPTSIAEEELQTIDRENDRRTFFPRLKKLAPRIYAASERLYRSGIPSDDSLLAGLPRERHELFLVLGLAEDRIERCELYRRGEDAASRRPLHEREEPDNGGYLFARPYDASRPPRELLWCAVYYAVMEELVEME